MATYLSPVYARDTHVEFLYTLLSQREPYQNISHKVMPTKEEHVNFIRSKPYRYWFIIMSDGRPVGSVYITKDYEIGLFIHKDEIGKGYGSRAIATMKNTFLDKALKANINPKNKKSIEFFKKHGFCKSGQISTISNCDKSMKPVVVQETYEFRPASLPSPHRPPF